MGEQPKSIQFKVQKHDPMTGKLKWEMPRWEKVEAEGNQCPLDGENMLVVAAGKFGMYAYCFKCQSYYIGK